MPEPSPPPYPPLPQSAEYVQSAFERKRPIDAFIQAWVPARYEEQSTDLTKVRKDLVMQRKWAKAVSGGQDRVEGWVHTIFDVNIANL